MKKRHIDCGIDATVALSLADFADGELIAPVNDTPFIITALSS